MARIRWPRGDTCPPTAQAVSRPGCLAGRPGRSAGPCRRTGPEDGEAATASGLAAGPAASPIAATRPPYRTSRTAAEPSGQTVPERPPRRHREAETRRTRPPRTPPTSRRAAGRQRSSRPRLPRPAARTARRHPATGSLRQAGRATWVRPGGHRRPTPGSQPSNIVQSSISRLSGIRPGEPVPSRPSRPRPRSRRPASGRPMRRRPRWEAGDQEGGQRAHPGPGEQAAGHRTAKGADAVASVSDDMTRRPDTRSTGHRSRSSLR